MIDRKHFLPQESQDFVWAAPVTPTCTVPPEGMAYLMAESLATDGDVLELGTGSGYVTAILAERCRSVTSVEIKQLPGINAKLPSNVVLFEIDAKDFETDNLYDGILVTFASEQMYSNWVAQLKIGGKLVVPVKMNSGKCRLSVYERTATGLRFLSALLYAPFTEEMHA